MIRFSQWLQAAVKDGPTAPELAADEEFFRDQHFFLLPVSRGSRERKSALMARGLLCLAALSGQPPEPGGSRRKARGVDGEKRAPSYNRVRPLRCKRNCVSVVDSLSLV